MIFKCNKCGYEVEELPTFTQYHNYGNSTYGVEVPDDMCSCGGDMVEGEHCERCDRFVEPCELHEGLCDVCYDDMYG